MILHVPTSTGMVGIALDEAEGLRCCANCKRQLADSGRETIFCGACVVIVRENVRAGTIGDFIQAINAREEG